MLKLVFKKKLLFIALILSITLSSYVYLKHDKEKFSNSNIQYNNFIKGDSAYYFLKARYFQKNLEQGNILAFSGDYEASFLYPVLIGGFYKFFNQNVFNTDEIQKINPPNPTVVKLFFLILQFLIYLCSVVFLVSRIDFFDEKLKKILMLFLIFEPTIFQYHSLFMTESLFLSFLNFFIAIIIKPPSLLFQNFLVGIFLGIAYLLKTTVFYILIPILFYLIIHFKKKFIKKFLSIFVGYLFVLTFLGYSNFTRSGLFYFIPTQANDAIYWYLADPIISKSKNITAEEAYKIKKDNERQWIKNKDLNLTKEKDRVQLSIYKKDYTLNLIKNNMVVTLKHVVWKTFQFFIIDFQHLANYLKINYVDKNYWKTDNFKLRLYVNIVYSIIIYSFVVIGFFKSFKKIDLKINFLFLILISYFTLLLSWSGGPRYNLPILLIFSFYFVLGAEYFIYKFLGKKFFDKFF